MESPISRRVLRVLGWLFCVYALVLAVVCLSSPLMALTGHPNLYDASQALMSMSCEQLPHRSFWIGGYPMACCARCFGFYIGAILPRSIKIPHWLGILSFLEKTLEWILPILAMDEAVQNVVRFFTGIIVVGYIVQNVVIIIKRRMRGVKQQSV